MGATVVASMLGYATGGIPSIAPLLALGSAAYYTGRRTTVVLAAAASLGLLALYLASDGGGGAIVDEATPPDFLVIWLAALAGDVLRGQHAYARTLEQRTEELARLRGAEKRDAIVAERARIARDMHDIVGHALAAIALQARAGHRRLAQGAVDRADVALREIDTLAGQALSDTRRAVGLLRSADAGVAPAGQPALDELDELVAALRTDDIQIDVHHEGPAVALPAPVQAAAYRIVQEGLSNVVKHAQPAHATVTLRQDDEGLLVDIRDDGAPRDRVHRPGHGLRGMRERVEAVGGTLHAGPAAGGGWHVRARLPQAPA
jgi:signal transduction histidine kinase